MTTTIDATKGTESDESYAELERLVGARVAAAEGPLFTTDADPGALWGHYLHHLPEERRQHYNCHACRRFVQGYGGLVTIDDAGHQVPVLWDTAGVPTFFVAAVSAVNDLVHASRVTGVFRADAATWGTPRTGDWSHLAGECFKGSVYMKGAVRTAAQEVAVKAEEHRMLAAALADYGTGLISEAIRLLRSGTLNRPEKALGVAEWLAQVHQANRNQLWLLVAQAPPGFCHVRSSVLGTLLDDLKAGFPFEALQRRWNEKLDPLAYQRPTAAPKSGTIEQAEKLVAQLGVERSLERRYATLADVTAKLWSPREVKTPGGVFGHLKPRAGVTPLETPPVKITWEKFAREVLPTAERLQVFLPPSQGPFYGLLTATHADAPNVLQWDNPVSWYFYSGGSQPSRWSLTGRWGEVTAAFLAPHQWSNPGVVKHHGRKVFFAIAGARDTAPDALGLFPEILRSEFHGIRAVLEAHSAKSRPTGVEAGNANGLAFQEGGPALTVRVDARSNYTIDRWD